MTAGIQTRYNGNSEGVVNVDRARADAGAAKIISTGIGKHITAIRIVGGATFADQMGVGGAVEAVLRTLQVKATTIAYQVDTTVLSVIVEATGWGVTNALGEITVTADADLTAALVALGNRAADTTIPVTAYNFVGMTATSTAGLKLAA